VLLCPSAANTHITIDASGVAHIDGTRMKVIHVAKEVVARRATPEQLRETFPHLSLAQIHAALAYYYDHQPQMDAEIQRELADYERDRVASMATDSPGRQKLRAQGHL
jgi:uncharacterized protein (DUF433 family)